MDAMIAPDARTPPLPSGTLCLKGSIKVRVYATIRVGEVWDGTYECYLHDEPRSTASRTYATMEQLEVCRG